MDTSKRFQILDCQINRTDMNRAVQSVLQQLTQDAGGYICFSNVHTVVTSRKDMRLRDVTNHSFMSMPDGKPLSIVAGLSGIKDMSQVAGPDFMLEMLGKHPTLRHFFYGSTEETLESLTEKLKVRFPGLNIAGTFSPPFRTLQSHEVNHITTTITQAKPDIVWVGLGAPKQEYWMADNWEQLKPAILMGVGAAFDFHAGKVARAPAWMKRLSLEWLFRLCQEPRRLWKRYLVTNSLFIYYLLRKAVFAKQNIHVDD